ncbi:Crp/Fnr family transcriptional regulator [Denitratisoma oestradiolicum]|uniref:Transcriptional regulator n=1 Tax=Denitratisoma oestradiolicum TaxID=311182 RepID=A0A6S6Y0M1_9PROT|nr:Crp/Fnr family transcriptional regulator [Denitratisoma oestradiolicum]TWO81507.1 transcriptional regulator [Denitratisoma oestradiolicum]CAB1368722.1 Transcriptional regulator [Denitratisoma oestradiolicum]
MTTPAHDTIASLYPVFAELPEPLRQSCLTAAQELSVPAGTTLFDAGQPCPGFPLVLAGSVRVVKSAANGRELPLYRIFPGESCIISSGCLLGHQPYTARGVSEGETRLLLLPAVLFEQLMAVPAFRAFVFDLFAERMADLMTLVEEVAFRKLDQRLADLLLGHGRVLYRTHQQLADELGSVREMVSRLLKGFAEQGLVRLGREQIEILDPEGLRRISGPR